MAKKITLKDLAEELNLSPASVSMILNRKSISRFSEETVAAVCKAAEASGYTTASSRSNKIVYIICPSIMNPYYATIIQNMENEAYMAGISTHIFTTYWDKDREKSILELAEQQGIYGVIFAMIPQQPELVRSLNKKITVVAVGDRHQDLGFDTVDINNYKAGELIADHLLELGHKHIAFISSTLNCDHSARVRRYEGIQSAFRRSCPDGSVSLWAREVTPDMEIKTTDIEYRIGRDMALACLADTPEVTALVAVNDMVGYGAADAIKESGKKIPEDYSLCGFDNIYPSAFLSTSLTTIEHSIGERGQSAFRLLTEKAQRKPSENTEAITRVEYQCKLIKRNSTGVPRDN